MNIPLKRRAIKYPRPRKTKGFTPPDDDSAKPWRTPSANWNVDDIETKQSKEDLFEWPRLYHTHHNCSLEDLSFWLSLARQQEGPILELGCGTGRVAIPLVRDGFVVFGLDRDLLMLEYLHSSINSASNLPLFIFQADMSEFHLEKKFPLILLPCNTLSTLSPKVRQGMLVCVKNHLTHDGIFAASLPNPHRLVNLPFHSDIELEDVFLDPFNGEPIQVSSSWDHDRQYFTLCWYYDHLYPDGLVERMTVSTQHDLSPLEVYVEEMKLINLSLVSTFGDFDFSKYHHNSPNLIILIKKC